MILMLLDFFSDFGNSDYWNRVMDGITFIVALGSLIGFLTLIFSALYILAAGQFHRNKGIKILGVGLLLCFICGFSTGLRFFHIYR